MIDLDELRARLRDIAAMELAPAEDEVAYGYHTRDWCEGYQRCARDFLGAVS